MKTITKFLFALALSFGTFSASAQWWAAGTAEYNGTNLVTLDQATPRLRFQDTNVNKGEIYAGIANQFEIQSLGTCNLRLDAAADGIQFETNNIVRGEFQSNGILNLTNSGICLSVGGAEALWSDADNYSWGFGKDYSYWANEMVIGTSLIPLESDGLTISGNEDLRFEGLGARYIRFTENGVQNAFMGHTGTDMYVRNYGALGDLYLDGEVDLYLQTNGSTKVSVKPTGNVGIGTTTPNQKLEVDGGNLAINDLGDILFRDASNVSLFEIQTGPSNVEFDCAAGDYGIGLDASGSGACYFNTNNGSRRMTITQDGDIGIGTQTPGKKLEVVGQMMLNNVTGYPATKQATMTMRHYSSSTNDFAYFRANASSSQNSVSFGGGAGANYAATTQIFYTAGNTTTLTGTERMRIRGDGRIAVGGPTATHTFNVTGTASKSGGGVWSAISDRRLKKGVREFDGGLEEVLKINPVYFQYKSGIDAEEGTEHVGVIAQDMQKVAPYTVKEVDNTVEEGQKRSIALDKFLTYDGTAVTYMLVNAVKELNEVVDTKDERIETLETELASMKDAIAQIQAQLANGATTTNVEAKLTEKNVTLNGTGSVAELAQNTPNPFNEATTINYFLPDGSTGAHMNIFSAEGKVLKTVQIDETGNGQVNLKANSLPAGNYMYQLVTDKGIVGSKTMVLAK